MIDSVEFKVIFGDTIENLANQVKELQTIEKIVYIMEEKAVYNKKIETWHQAIIIFRTA